MIIIIIIIIIFLIRKLSIQNQGYDRTGHPRNLEMVFAIIASWLCRSCRMKRHAICLVTMFPQIALIPHTLMILRKKLTTLPWLLLSVLWSDGFRSIVLWFFPLLPGSMIPSKQYPNTLPETNMAPTRLHLPKRKFMFATSNFWWNPLILPWSQSMVHMEITGFPRGTLL